MRLGRRLVVRRIAQREDAVPRRHTSRHAVAFALPRRSAAPGNPADAGCDPLLERQRRDRLVAWAIDERILRHLEPEQDAGRPREHLARIGRPDALASSIQPVSRRHSSGLLSRCRHGDRHRPPRHVDQPAQHRELVVRIVEVRDDLDPAACPISRNAAAIADSSASLGALSVGMARPSSVVVVERARRGEAQRAGADAFRREPAIAGDPLGGRLAIGAALAHDEHPQGGMRHLGRDVDVVPARCERIEEVRENSANSTAGLRVSTTSGMSSTPSISLTSRSRCRRLARREADAAIAEQRRS